MNVFLPCKIFHASTNAPEKLMRLVLNLASFPLIQLALEDSMKNRLNGFTFSSFHPGGAQFAFVDSSVHFIAKSSNCSTSSVGTYHELGDRSDGQTVGEF